MYSLSLSYYHYQNHTICLVNRHLLLLLSLYQLLEEVLAFIYINLYLNNLILHICSEIFIF